MSIPYRYNPHRALPPIILASPGAHALFNGTKKRTIADEMNNPGGFKRLVRDLCEGYFPVVKDAKRLRLGGQFGGNCLVSTIWSDSPDKPDILLVQSDNADFCNRVFKYDIDDPRFRAEFTPLILV